MVAIIDYGAGNLRSIHNKLSRLGIDAVITSDEKVIMQADKLILPGVGFFASGMENLKKSGLIEILNQKVLKEKTPILGVCLGMQLLFEYSQEGDAAGLGWIKGDVKKFNFPKKRLKVPHMGWNTIKVKKSNKLLNEIPKNAQFYFVHSYHVCPKYDKNILATTNYGYDFTSVVVDNNIYGTQFHPEKSHSNGIQIIKNFAGKV